MITTTALLQTSRGQQWLSNTARAKILHLFDDVCNLINSENQLLSLVTEQIGAGPFNLLLPLAPPLTRLLKIDFPIQVQGNVLQCGNLQVRTGGTPLWPAVPQWENWRGGSELITARTNRIAAWAGQKCAPVLRYRAAKERQLLLQGLHGWEIEAVASGAASLAGLGPGLTPAGDDYLLGVLCGLWAANHPGRPAFTTAIITASVPRTNTLAGAWLQAVAGGEVGHAWHALCETIAIANDRWLPAVGAILETGHSSGADALLGFTDLWQHLGG